MSGEKEKTPEPPVDPAPAAKDEPLGDGGLKALQTEREARKNLEKEVADLKPLAEKVKAAEEKAQAAEDAKKTDIQKALDRINELEAKTQVAELGAMRLSVAADYKLSREDAETFLTATDREGIQAQAKRLSEIHSEREVREGNKGDPAQGVRQKSNGDAWADGKAVAERMFGKPGT